MTDMLFISMKSLLTTRNLSIANLPRSSSDSSPFESVRNKILSFFSSQVNQAKTLSGERQGTGAGLFIGRPRISGI